METNNKRGLHLNLFHRIFLFLIVFVLCIFLQLGISAYKGKYIMDPIQKSAGNVQTISLLLDSLGQIRDLLSSYRWDFGDVAVLVSNLRKEMEIADESLAKIDTSIASIGVEQYLLVSAVNTTYQNCSDYLSLMQDQLIKNNIDKASELYYSNLEPCLNHLYRYMQQLIERAIMDNQSTYDRLIKRNEQLDTVYTLTVLVMLLFGFVAFREVIRMVSIVQEMARSSKAITAGDYDRPELLEHRKDEIGDMARAFNEMKRAMRNQVRLLTANNEMEKELYRKDKEALAMQNLLEREKLQLLRSQINPHFLFNTINMIKYTAQEEMAEKTDALLSSLSRIFRYSLADNGVLVPLSREIQIVDEYYSLYKVRFKEKVSLVWNISPSLVLTETLVPSFFFQPLVENAFKHGLGPKELSGTVYLTLEEKEGMLWVFVEDDGVGMEEEKLQMIRSRLLDPPMAGEHIGLYSVFARLKLIDARCVFEVTSQKGRGTTIQIKMPLMLNDEEEVYDKDIDCR
ncbi:HAMP domain-containing protein [Sphaerochaeta halotolerans]|nr:HAMP domain-containing protein [Sphaerochaeta halotolerans]